MQAYLIVGPESSGNRMMGGILCAAGARGDSGTKGPYARKLPPKGLRRPPVVIRSYPHAGVWPDLVDVCSTLTARGYRPTVVVINREIRACARSQVARGHQDTEGHAHASILRALVEITDGIRRAVLSVRPAPHVEWVTYEAVSTAPLVVIPDLLGRIGLDPLGIMKVEVEGRVRDIECQNAKHYGMEVVH